MENPNNLRKDGYFYLDQAAATVSAALAAGRALSDDERAVAIVAKSKGARLLKQAREVEDAMASSGLEAQRGLAALESGSLDCSALSDRLATLERTAARIRSSAVSEKRNLTETESRDLIGLHEKVDALRRTKDLAEQLSEWYAE